MTAMFKPSLNKQSSMERATAQYIQTITFAAPFAYEWQLAIPNHVTKLYPQVLRVYSLT